MISGSTSFTPFASPGVIVDSSLPTVTQFILPANGEYTVGSVLYFSVVLSYEIQFPTSSTGTLALSIGGVSRNAGLLNATNTLTKAAIEFSYVIQLGDSAASGIGILGTIVLPNSTLSAGTNQPVTLSFSPPDGQGIVIN